MPGRFPKVFGIGLSRTGNTSLTRALRALGFRAVQFPDNLNVLAKADAGTDTTVALAYRELDKCYPGSGFILTVRDVPTWLRSMEWMMGRLPLIPLAEVPYRLEIRRKAYGTESFEPAKLEIAFERHVRDVREYFAGRKDFLELDIAAGDGWEKLAPFLGVAVPTEAFPHEHRRTA